MQVSNKNKCQVLDWWCIYLFQTYLFVFFFSLAIGCSSCLHKTPYLGSREEVGWIQTHPLRVFGRKKGIDRLNVSGPAASRGGGERKMGEGIRVGVGRGRGHIMKVGSSANKLRRDWLCVATRFSLPRAVTLAAISTLLLCLQSLMCPNLSVFFLVKYV